MVKAKKTGSRRLWIILGAGICAAFAVISLYLFSQIGKTKPENMQWGVTFSHLAAKDLGIDHRESYRAVVQELKPDRLRLVAYWSEIEPTPGQNSYDYLDYQVSLAEQAGIPYSIAVGKKVPRYPECFIPEWVKKLPEAQSQQKLLDHLARTVKRYDSNSKLIMWQLENEPYLEFGVCPPLDVAALNQEIDHIKQLSDKPIMMTDSGEGSWWLKASARADVFGTTLYRSVLNGKGGVFTHFIPPWVYGFRANLVKAIHPNVKRVVVAELQAEPWGSPLNEKSQEFTDLTLSRQKLADNIKFSQKTGMPEHYLWGVEWWYFKKQQGNDVFWNDAKRLFETGSVN